MSHWTTRYFNIIDNTPPKLSLNYPKMTNKSKITISGQVTDKESGVLGCWFDGRQLVVDKEGQFSVVISLTPDINKFSFQAVDRAGNRTEQKIVSIFYDNTPPQIEIWNPKYSPYEKIVKVVGDIKIIGKVSDDYKVKDLIINNEKVAIDKNGMFVYQTQGLHFGANAIHISVLDYAGNETKKELLISKVQYQKKIVFVIGNPNMVVWEPSSETGKEEQVIKEIDPGRGTVPVIRWNRTFIPIRALVETTSGKVQWDAKARKVTIYDIPNRSIKIELWIGKSQAKVTDTQGSHWVPIEEDNNQVKPFIKNGRSYFPLRFIMEIFGLPLDAIRWNAVTKSVTIYWPIYPKP